VRGLDGHADLSLHGRRRVRDADDGQLLALRLRCGGVQDDLRG
jgi:hypothetical protein